MADAAGGRIGEGLDAAAKATGLGEDAGVRGGACADVDRSGALVREAGGGLAGRSCRFIASSAVVGSISAPVSALKRLTAPGRDERSSASSADASPRSPLSVSAVTSTRLASRGSKLKTWPHREHLKVGVPSGSTDSSMR